MVGRWVLVTGCRTPSGETWKGRQARQWTRIGQRECYMDRAVQHPAFSVLHPAFNMGRTLERRATMASEKAGMRTGPGRDRRRPSRPLHHAQIVVLLRVNARPRRLSESLTEPPGIRDADRVHVPEGSAQGPDSCRVDRECPHESGRLADRDAHVSHTGLFHSGLSAGNVALPTRWKLWNRSSRPAITRTRTPGRPEGICVRLGPAADDGR